MAFNIDSFTGQHFTRDFYRPNLFFVEVNQAPVDFDSDFKFLVKASNLPSSTVESLEVPFLNRIIKVAGDRTFEDWTITVMNDEDFVYRHLMEQWMENINFHESNDSSAPIEYKGTMTIRPHDRQGNEIGSYTFHGIYPTTLDAIDVAWESGAAPSEYGVTFAYDYWTGDATSD